MTACDVAEVGRIFRAEYGRAVASLVRHLGDIDLAEEAIQEAFAVAVQKWPETGLPPSPAGWIITTGRNRAVDWLRREATREHRPAQADLGYPAEPNCPTGCVRYWRCCTSYSTRGTRPAPARPWYAPPCAPRRSGWPGSWPT